MTAAFLVWSVYFVIIYAWLSVACAGGVARPIVGAALAVLTAATLAAITWLGWRALRAWRTPAGASASADGRGRFMALTAALGAGLALVATLWVAAPILVLEPCV